MAKTWWPHQEPRALEEKRRQLTCRISSQTPSSCSLSTDSEAVLPHSLNFSISRSKSVLNAYQAASFSFKMPL
ncbi:hypothetical protein Mapa_012115 [Marchantia paleacea]|nr:hypothetical protein Mapa_012115 [Marchantia paleacea]